MGLLLSIAKMFSSFRPGPLPSYPMMASNEPILPGSIALFYGGMELTEVAGNYIYHHPYKPAAFHAAGVITDNRVLNINAFATIDDISSMFKSTRRVDIIELLDLTDVERQIICKKFERDAGRNFYDAVGYLRFGGKLKVLGFLKKLHASKDNDFCSDNVCDNFSQPPMRHPNDTDAIIQSLTLPRKIDVSYYPSKDTAPWHLLEHALDKNFQNGTRRVRTIWVGPDFKI